jgi:uncharacterized protein YndB with AHSA1/START domain
MADTQTDRIEKQIEIKAAPSRVWRALTDYKEFGEWFRVRLESPFVAGKATRGQITHPGYEHVVMEVAVQSIKPETYFSFHWHPYAIEKGVDYSKEKPTLVEFRLEKPRAARCSWSPSPDLTRSRWDGGARPSA